MNTGHVLSLPSLNENQRLSSTGQVDLGNIQEKIAQFFGSPLSQDSQLTPANGSYHPSRSPTMNEKHSLSHPSLDEVFPYAIELPTSGVNGPGERFALSSTPPVSGATHPQESRPDYSNMK